MTYEKLVEEQKKYEKQIDLLRVQLGMMTNRAEKLDVAARIIKLTEKHAVLDKYFAAGNSQEEIDAIKAVYQRFCADVDFIKGYLIFDAVEEEPTTGIEFNKKRAQIIKQLVQEAGLVVRKVKVLKKSGQWIIAA